MTKLQTLLLAGLIPGFLAAQPLDPALLTKPLSDSWPTYSGDYSSKRYSSLKQVNQTNVKNLTLAWASRVTAGAGDAGGGGRGGRGGFGGGGIAPTIIGGEGTADAGGGGAANIRSSVLAINGVLYFSTPDNAWAMDARDGHTLWHYFWKTKGGTHIGNRGLAMWGNWLYLETPDDYLVCLDAATGKERWHKEIANFNQQYFSTMSPVVIGNHVITGTGNDLDEPGYVQALDPETGNRAVDLPHCSYEEGRPWPRYLGQPGWRQARRRQRLDSRLLRP